MGLVLQSFHQTPLFPRYCPCLLLKFAQSLKPWNKLKMSLHLNIFTDSLSCPQALQYVKLEHPLIGMMIRKCVFFNFANKDIICLLATQPY